MTLNIFLADLFIFFICYKLPVMAFEALLMGLRQAEFLENEFGTDLAGAARYQFLGKWGSKDG